MIDTLDNSYFTGATLEHEMTREATREKGGTEVEDAVVEQQIRQPWWRLGRK